MLKKSVDFIEFQLFDSSESIMINIEKIDSVRERSTTKKHIVVQVGRESYNCTGTLDKFRNLLRQVNV